MIKVKCLLDFYCLSGKLRFKAGEEYEFNNGIVESKNYHLHYRKELNHFFNFEHVKPTDL